MGKVRVSYLKQRIATLVVLLAVSSIPLAVLAVQAPDGGAGGQAGSTAPVYDWVNSATIQYHKIGEKSTKSFVNNKIDKRGVIGIEAQWLWQPDPDKCPDYITLGSTDYLNVSIPDISATRHGCKPGTKTGIYLGSKENADIDFVQTDSNTFVIPGNSRNWVFSYDGARKTFIRNKDNTCFDTLQKAPNGTWFFVSRREQHHLNDGGWLNPVFGNPSNEEKKTDYLGEDYFGEDFQQYIAWNEDDDGSQPPCWISGNVQVHVFELTTAGKPDPTIPVGGATGNDDACANASGAYAWMLCPAVAKAADFSRTIYSDVIGPLLSVDPLTMKNKKGAPNSIYVVWKSFVALANVLFVLAFLGIIFGTVFNLDAYTIKKAMPRLVIAAIAVQISFFICGVLIDISNIFGSGLLDFITNSVRFPEAGYSNKHGVDTVLSYGFFALGGLLTVGAALLGPAVALMIVGLVVAALTFIFTLLVRQVLITALIIVSPIAIVAWILPNTEGLFKKWKDNFLKTLFIYPIISLLIGAGYIVQVISQVDKSLVSQLIGGLAPIIVFFMMPAVFKMSGKAMALAGGAAAGIGLLAGKKAEARTQKAYDNSARLKQRKADKFEKNVQLAQGEGFRARNAQRKAGFGFKSTPLATAQLNAAADKAEKEELTGATRQLKDMDVGVGGEGLQFATQALGSKTSSGQVVTKANQKAAVEKILASKNMAALEQVKNTMDAGTYKQLTQASFSDIRSLSPDLVPGGDESAYDNISAEHMLSLNAHGRQKLLDRMASPAGAAAQANATKAYATINASQTLRGKLTGEHRAALDPTGTIFK